MSRVGGTHPRNLHQSKQCKVAAAMSSCWQTLLASLTSVLNFCLMRLMVEVYHIVTCSLKQNSNKNSFATKDGVIQVEKRASSQFFLLSSSNDVQLISLSLRTVLIFKNLTPVSYRKREQSDLKSYSWNVRE